MGCHFLLQCVKVKSESEVAQSCPTFCDPWTAAYLAPLSMGFSRQEYWSGVPLPSPHSFYIYIHSIYFLLKGRGEEGVRCMERVTWKLTFSSVQFSSVTQSCTTLCDPMNRSTPGLLSITISQSSLRLTSIESMMPSSHLILCRPLLPCPQSFPASGSFLVSQLFA